MVSRVLLLVHMEFHLNDLQNNVCIRKLGIFFTVIVVPSKQKTFV